MTRERWEQVLFAHVSDETVQDMLNQYVLELESSNTKLRELLRVMAYCNQFRRDCDGCSMNGAAGIITGRAGCDELLVRMRELGVKI